MVLADSEIKKLVKEKNLIYLKGQESKAEDFHIVGSSFDLRLGNEFLVYDRYLVPTLDYKNLDALGEKVMKKVSVTDEEGIIMQPKEFLLGTTREYVKIPRNITARIEGKSSYGRLGLLVHASASFIDPGFEGRLTLELYNLNNIPLKLYPGKRVCQLALEYIDGEVETAYGERERKKYYKQDVKGAQLSYKEAKKLIFD